MALSTTVGIPGTLSGAAQRPHQELKLAFHVSALPLTA